MQEFKRSIFVLVAACLLAPTAHAQYQFVDLAPNNTPARANATLVTAGGDQQYGAFSPTQGTSGSPAEAAIFSGAGGPITDLGVGWVFNAYSAPGGTYEVGYLGSGGARSAVLWSGSAATAVNLSPSGWYSSTAAAGYYAASTGAQQVGYGQQARGAAEQALLWNGSASGVTNLTPSGSADAYAWSGFSVGSQGIQVGEVDTSTSGHAVIWTGSAASLIDLTPTSTSYDAALGGAETSSGGIIIVGQVNGDPVVWQGPDANHLTLTDLSSQVGAGSAVATNGRLVLGNAGQPFVWDSQTGAVTELEQFMPGGSAGGYVGVNAYGIDAAGDVVGSANTIPPGGSGPTEEHALEWVAIPEPSGAAVLAMSAILLGRRARRRVVT